MPAVYFNDAGDKVYLEKADLRNFNLTAMIMAQDIWRCAMLQKPTRVNKSKFLNAKCIVQNCLSPTPLNFLVKSLSYFSLTCQMPFSANDSRATSFFCDTSYHSH